MPNASEVASRVHDGVHSANPFQTVSSHSKNSVIAYKIITPISWLVLVITSVYYDFAAPHEGKYSRHTIWRQNSVRHSPFALNSIITSLYWIALFIIQIPYVASLFQNSEQVENHNTAYNLAPHFIFNNLLWMGFIHLWCRSYFWWAELLVIVNFFQLTFTYFRYPSTTKITHAAALAGPLAFSFVALYWTGAAAVHSHHFAGRVAANVFIWTWAVYGGFYLFVFKDWTMGFALSILSAALGVAQFLTVIVAVQWIEAFIIMALLFLVSLAVAVPGVVGKEPFRRGEVVSEDRERAPLLADSSNNV
ncbi:DUF1774-domain-containing protein [Tothia fuscella]|uniref:DUF1774-domain-containing protein n=1 Tax=Tothia fuscella TaxID=1048955 RepID=A0A9P4NK03_9PEZI|nr:DUF1774-domain-containing protein [Tothia fuscella]